MRIAVVLPVATALLLSGCGSSSTAPVESASPSGAVAGAADACPAGPPASSLLNTTSFGHDGVVGAIYNQSGAPVWIQYNSSLDITTNARRDTCRLDPGQRAAYAGNYGTDGKPRDSVWGPALGAGVIIYASASADMASGTAILTTDPNSSTPRAGTMGFTADYSCARANEALSARSEYSFAVSNDYGTSGRVVVKRLDDDKNVSKEWTGHSGWEVNDWARMDINIYTLGTCSRAERVPDGGPV